MRSTSTARQVFLRLAVLLLLLLCSSGAGAVASECVLDSGALCAVVKVSLVSERGSALPTGHVHMALYDVAQQELVEKGAVSLAPIATSAAAGAHATEFEVALTEKVEIGLLMVSAEEVTRSHGAQETRPLTL